MSELLGIFGFFVLFISSACYSKDRLVTFHGFKIVIIERRYISPQKKIFPILSNNGSLERLMGSNNQYRRTKLTRFEEGYNSFLPFFVTKTLFLIMNIII